MIKVSKMADYAVVILGEMSRNSGGLMSAAALSAILNLPEPTVAKILKMLSAADLVTSVRGAGGGYRLTKGSDEISILDIVVGIDGPVAVVACAEVDAGDCRLQDTCCVRGCWDSVNDVIRNALSEKTLAQMFVREEVV